MKRAAEEEREQEPAAEKTDTTKKAKRAAPTEEAVFSIGGKRKITVSVFKGKVLVNIREFYDDKSTGEEKPGSKGIALLADQWRSLAAQMKEIDEAVTERS